MTATGGKKQKGRDKGRDTGAGRPEENRRDLWEHRSSLEQGVRSEKSNRREKRRKSRSLKKEGDWARDRRG